MLIVWVRRVEEGTEVRKYLKLWNLFPITVYIRKLKYNSITISRVVFLFSEGTGGENKLSLTEWSNSERKEARWIKHQLQCCQSLCWALSKQWCKQIWGHGEGGGGREDRAAKIQDREAYRNCPLALWQKFNQAEPWTFPCTDSIVCVHLQTWLLAHSLCLGS